MPRCCSKHEDRPLEAWCTGCRVAVCLRCAAFDHRGAEHGAPVELEAARVEQAAALQTLLDELESLQTAGLGKLAEAFDGGVAQLANTEADAVRSCQAAFAWLQASVVAGVTKQRDATLKEIALQAAQAKAKLSTKASAAADAAADPAVAAARSRGQELLAPTTPAAELLDELPSLIKVLAGCAHRAHLAATPSAAEVVELFASKYGPGRFVVAGPLAERFASSATSAALTAFGAVTGGGVDGIVNVPMVATAAPAAVPVPPAPAPAVVSPATAAERTAPAATQQPAAAAATGDAAGDDSAGTVLRFEGIKTESNGLSAAALLASGWELVHCKPYRHAFSSGDLSACVKAAGAGAGTLLIAARRTGEDMLVVAAMAPASVIAKNTGPHTYNQAGAAAELTNGAYWYARGSAPTAPTDGPTPPPGQCLDRLTA